MNIYVQWILDPGWTGRDCSIDIDECQTIQPCKAAKSCINLPGSYKCDCFDSFGGQNCEMVGNWIRLGRDLIHSFIR